MQAARKLNGELIYVTQDLTTLQKEDATLFCPKCHRPVSICVQKDGRYYFRHAQRGRTRKHGGETIQHLNGKIRLYQWLKPSFPECRLEVLVNEQAQRSDLLLWHQKQQIALEYQCSLIAAQEIDDRTAGYQAAQINCIWIFGERYYQMKRLGDCFETTLRYSRLWGNFLLFLVEDELIVKHHISLKTRSRNMCYQELRFSLKQWQPERFIHYWMMQTYKGAQPMLNQSVKRTSQSRQQVAQLHSHRKEQLVIHEEHHHTYANEIRQPFTTQEMTRIRLSTEPENRQFLHVLYRDNVTLEQLPAACFTYPRYSFAWRTPDYIWKGYVWHWLVTQQFNQAVSGKEIVQYVADLVSKGWIRPSALCNQWALVRVAIYQFLLDLELEGVIEPSRKGYWQVLGTS